MGSINGLKFQMYIHLDTYTDVRKAMASNYGLKSSFGSNFGSMEINKKIKKERNLLLLIVRNDYFGLT